MKSNDILAKKKIIFILFFVIGLFLILIIRVGIIELIQGTKWKTKAEEQLNVNRKLTASRGIIYDATGKNILAQSSTVYTITVNPVNITNENKEKITEILSRIFELDYEKILKKLNKKSFIETIIRRVEKERIDKLLEWMNENKVYTGINIDEDSKRFYPYSNLASQVIGFVGNDNQGLEGIEAKYDEILTGKNGSISKMLDAKGNIIKNTSEKYSESIRGNDLILSIDMNIQSIAQKYLEIACLENVCTDGGNVIIMSPKTGDILAMATYPSYDLNNPYEVQDIELKNAWQEISREEKNKILQSIWRNKAIADTYEPGSTFKLVTTAAALEEKIANYDDKKIYNCGGSIEIAGTRIKCWRYYRPHGMQSLTESLMNSCNPVFIGLGQKIGVKKYYEYLRKFGFLERTGIDLIGEASSIFLKEEKVGPIELATISFGQRFEVTPVQMITMVSTIANKGLYVKPRIVKSIINSETGEKVDLEPEFKNQVVSEDTANNILEMMTSVVSEGTGKNAQVQGYKIGGKTGTSEDGVNTGKYVTSFIGIAPTDNPEITILVTLYNPTGEAGHQGGTVAAPVAGKILEEILSYLQIQSSK